VVVYLKKNSDSVEDALNDALDAAADADVTIGSGSGSTTVGGSNYNSNATHITFGTVAPFNTSRPYDIKSVKLSATKLVVMFRDMATGGRLKAIVGDINGTTINMGPKQAIDDDCTGCYMASITALSSTRIAVTYPDSNNSNRGTARTCDISGTTLTCNEPSIYTINSISTGLTNVITLNSSKIVVSYNDDGTTGKANVGTVAVNGTINFGTSASFDNGLMMVFQTASVLSESQFIIAYEDGSNMHGKAVVGTVSGTNIIFGNEFTFTSEVVALGIASTPLTSNKFAIAYVKQSSAGAALIGNISGTGATASITFGAEALFSDQIEQDLSISALASDKFVVSFINNNVMDYGQHGGVATVGKVSGSGITYGWGYRFHQYGFSKPVYASVTSFSDQAFLTLVCDKETNVGAAYVGIISAI
jgi:hypothetical protein